jgi:hypothetical protein
MLVTSFMPLWVSIAIIDIWSICRNPYSSTSQLFHSKYVELSTTLFFLIILTISLISILRFLGTKSKKNENSGVAKVLSAKKSDTLVSDFLLAYVLPMIAFDFTSLQGILLFLIYFCVLAFLSIRNNNVYTNILFEFKKYRMYNCELEYAVAGKAVTRDDCTVFSKSNLIIKVNSEITYFDFNNDIYIDLSHNLKGVNS